MATHSITADTPKPNRVLRGRGRNTPAASAPIPPAPSDQPMTRPESASIAANARWAGERASEADLQEFFTTCSVDKGLEILATMRSHCEMAAKLLNSRLSADTPSTLCKTCDRPKLPNRQWALVRPVKNHTTQGIYNEYFCSPSCVARENLAKQGVAAVPR